MAAEKQKTILLVEDEVITAMSEKVILEKYGYKVVPAYTGEEAIAVFAKMPGIDLILMDIDLGAGMDGTEAAAALLKQRDLPVVFLSSHMEPEVVAKTERITSYGYVVKNSSSTVLDASIKMAFKLFEAKSKEKEEESRREAALEALARQNDALSKLNQFSIELSMLSSKDNLEALIAKRIKEIAGAEMAAFSEYDPENRTTTIRNIEMEPGLLKKAADLLGKQVEKIHSTVSAEMYQEITKEIIGMRKTLHEVSFGAISRPVGAAIQALLNVDRFIGIAYLVEGKLYGTSVLAMNQDQPDPAQPILENFSFLASVSLRRKRTESQRDAALAKLRASKEQYRQLFEGANLGVFQSTPEGKVITVNSAFARMFGYDSPQDAILNIENVAVDIFVDPMRRGEIIRLLAEQPDLRTFENLYRRKNGSSFIGNLNTMPIRDSAGCLVRIEGIIEDISERRQAEALLQQERELYLDLVNNQPVGIYRLRVFPREQWQKDAWNSSENSPYSLELVNDRFCEILGINRQVCETNPGFLNDLIYAEDKEEFARKNEEANVKMVPFQWEGRLSIKGKILWVHFQSLPRPGANGDVLWLGTLYDITERKQAEFQREAALEALRESEDRYRDLVENSQDLICTHDLDGKVLSMNEAAVRLTGYPHADLLRMNMADLLQPDVRHLFKVYLAEIRSKGWARGTMRVQTAGGEPRHWEFYNTLRTKGVAVPVIRGLGHDITERERAEVEIKRQLSEKEILLKEVHHRIKNNIASIGGLISLRLQSTTNPEATTVLKDAIGRVDSMRILYDKLLLSEDYKDISVKNYVESLIDTVLALFPDNAKVKIDKRIGDFHLDSKRLFPLGIIVNELITNIMKYAFRDLGGGLIKIALVNLDNQVTLTIRDNGIGLPDGFDINRSTGFGLMLVKMLSQQLGGSFSIKKHAGTQCKVVFTI